MATTTAAPKPDKPTTVRICGTSLESLEKIGAITKLTKNALVGLAVEAFVDFVERTGKLPVPKLQRRRKSEKGGSDEQ